MALTEQEEGERLAVKVPLRVRAGVKEGGDSVGVMTRVSVQVKVWVRVPKKVGVGPVAVRVGVSVAVVD